MEFMKKFGDKITPYVLITDGINEEEVSKITACTPKNKEKIIVAIDHDTPCGTVEAAFKQKALMEFAKKHQLTFHYGQGISYYLAMENNLKAQDIVIGTGKHITTVGAAGSIGIKVETEQLIAAIKSGVLCIKEPEILVVEVKGALKAGVYAKDFALTLIQNKKELQNKLVVFVGENEFTMADKITICNLLTNADVFSAVFSDENERADFVYDLKDIEMKTVMPGGFENITAASAIDGLRVNQVFIGGCIGGNIESMRVVSKIFKNHVVNKYVRVMIAPATSKVYEQMIDEGLLEDILDSGALIMNQGCSACWAKSQGLIDDEEVFVTTGSINKENWAGLRNNKIYITSPQAAAKCALTGNLYEN